LLWLDLIKRRLRKESTRDRGTAEAITETQLYHAALPHTTVSGCAFVPFYCFPMGNVEKEKFVFSFKSLGRKYFF